MHKRACGDWVNEPVETSSVGASVLTPADEARARAAVTRSSADEPIPASRTVHELLVRSAKRVTGGLVVSVPLLLSVSILSGEATLVPTLKFLVVIEAAFVGVWYLARGRVGDRWPELVLFAVAVLASAAVIFSPTHIQLGYKPYALLAPMAPYAFAAMAPVRPWLSYGIAAANSILYALALWFVPASVYVEPVSYAALSFVLAWLAASYAREQLVMYKALDETRERALESTRLKSEFLANMSHEIRTPMTAILGFAEEVEVELGSLDVSAKVRAGLATIRRNGVHLLSLINGILDLSKIEAGKLDVAREPCSPARLVAEVSNLLRAHALEKGLTLETVAVGPIPKVVESDRMRLRQILINLVGNAVKFTEHGSVRIEVGTMHAPDGSGVSIRMLEFAVVDTGCGISPQETNRVFEVFTQVQGSLTRVHQGTGLGLALSRKLARMLGGEITVKSDLGRGSRFSLRVPVGALGDTGDIPAAELGDSALHVKIPATPRLHGLSGRVLLVEDGLDNQRLISAILRRSGLHVDIAADGAIGCELALLSMTGGELYDVILMDMQMPVMDGYTAVERLRGAGYGGAIVALTAHAMSGDRDRCLAIGCNDYATKPIVREELLQQVAAYLTKPLA
jgi:signal transduction histidine kinase/CheY-like chemotaxis protein